MGFNWGKRAVGSKKILLLLYIMSSLTFAKPVIYSEYAEPWKFHPRICRTNPSFLYKKKFEKPLFHILKNMTPKYLFKLYTNTYAYRIEFYFSL